MITMEAEILNLGVLVVVTIAGMVARSVISLLKKKGIMTNLENNKEIAKIVVNGIEQGYKHMEGEKKARLAKEEFLKFAKQKGVKVSEAELDMLIEASVKSMNKAIKDELKK